MPSEWYENAPITILEALSYGKKILASNIGGIPEMVHDNKNGFLVRAHSARAIHEACNKILRDPKLQERLGKNARKTVKYGFTWSKITREIRTKYINAKS